tara:strand:- start:2575 stop:3249 length:675 start_codon:yes stop_codon:yes gene_type:complete
MEDKTKDFVALLLSAPASSIALVTTNLFAGILGSIVFALGKIWQMALPGIWRIKVENKNISWSPAKNGGWLVASGLGVGMGLVMLAAWWLLGDNLDSNEIKSYVEPFGLLNPWMYFALFCYWVLINSIMEEYLFRWFIFEKFETFVSGKVAVILSGLVFTIHHFIGVMVMFPLPLALLASFGVFCGGAIWSWIYLRYRSIWPCYLSHAIVDVVMFGIGAYILFS